MLIEVKLQDPFSYSIIPIIILGIILIIPIIYFIIKKLTFKNNQNKVVANINVKDLANIKAKYLNEINVLENEFDNKLINNRNAYQKLSLILRLFVFEVTNVEFHKCTLEDIKNLNIPVLYSLVEEYYHPEFALLSRSNLKSSIAKTKEVITRWN